MAWLGATVGSGEAPASCYAALTAYRNYKTHHEAYLRHNAQRDHWERQAKTALRMADQPGMDRKFWENVAEQHRWHAENQVRSARQAVELADTAKLSGDQSFLECRDSPRARPSRGRAPPFIRRRSVIRSPLRRATETKLSFPLGTPPVQVKHDVNVVVNAIQRLWT